MRSTKPFAASHDPNCLSPPSEPALWCPQVSHPLLEIQMPQLRWQVLQAFRASGEHVYLVSPLDHPFHLFDHKRVRELGEERQKKGKPELT